MDSQHLREMQRTLKSKYRSDASTAQVTLNAEGAIGVENISCSVQTGKALIEAGLHPATGGDGSYACSGDMLLQALVACAGVTMLAVATNRGLHVEGKVRAEGDLDFRGTLGLDSDVPVGFTAIRVVFEVTSPASDEDLRALISSTQRYCVVLQTLIHASHLEVSSTRVAAT